MSLHTGRGSAGEAWSSLWVMSNDFALQVYNHVTATRDGREHIAQLRVSGSEHTGVVAVQQSCLQTCLRGVPSLFTLLHVHPNLFGSPKAQICYSLNDVHLAQNPSGVPLSPVSLPRLLLAASVPAVRAVPCIPSCHARGHHADGSEHRCALRPAVPSPEPAANRCCPPPQQRCSE